MGLAAIQEEKKEGTDEPSVRKLSAERFEQIVLEHREHGRRLAWSFLSSWRVRLHHDDVTSIVGAALSEAAHRFDESRGVSFKTFLFYHLRGMLLKEIARAVSEQRVLQYVPGSTLSDGMGNTDSSQPFPELQPVEHDDPEKIAQRQELASICFEACKELDELERQIVIRHYVYDEPLIEIAEDLDYCRCHISRVKSRGLSKLEGYLRDRLYPEQSRALREKIAARAAASRTRAKPYTGGRGRRKSKPPLRLVSQG